MVIVCLFNVFIYKHFCYYDDDIVVTQNAEIQWNQNLEISQQILHNFLMTNTKKRIHLTLFIQHFAISITYYTLIHIISI